ncbi:hypothetical protein [Photobacterium kishitanii]|uniref:hypothetical protein n=1 Tax=Photobacterium kishitanii TaxID=318456 RepID=UPI002739066D|nr:hypothetical protein [Photobacterium kishitanii]
MLFGRVSLVTVRSFFETKDDFIWWLQLDRTTKNQFISYIQNTTPDKFILNNRIINNMSSIIKTFQFIIELIYDGVRDSSIKHIMKDPSISSELLNNFRGDHVINQKLTIKLETQLSKIFSRTSFFEDQFRKPIESTKIEDKIEMLRYLKSYCDDVSYALLITFIRKETKRLMSANEFNIRMHHMARLYLAPNPKFQNELDNWVKHKK